MEQKKEERNVPIFPAMHMCIVIDARHGSRLEIVRDLKAGGLFENIIEAKSLDDGLRIVEGHAVDACFIGPSVSPIKAAAFIQQASGSALAPDCAFITVTNQGSSHIQDFEAAGSHYVIQIPCTKMKFTEGIVRGVIKANAGSPWAGILLNAEQDGINPFEGITDGSVQVLVAASGESPPSGDKHPRTETASVLGTLLQKATPEMRIMISHIESGDYGVDEKGEPTPKTAAAIARLVEGILAGTELGQKTEKFKTFFEAALVQWFLDLKQYGQRDATEELKLRLAEYQE